MDVLLFLVGILIGIVITCIFNAIVRATWAKGIHQVKDSADVEAGGTKRADKRDSLTSMEMEIPSLGGLGEHDSALDTLRNLDSIRENPISNRDSKYNECLILEDEEAEEFRNVDVAGITREIGYKNLTLNLKHLHEMIQLVQRAYADTDLQDVDGKSRTRHFLDMLEVLEQCEEMIGVLQVSTNQVSMTTNFLLDAAEDEHVDAEEREVARWITTQFLNSQAEDTSATPRKTTPTRETPAFQRFDSTRMFDLTTLENNIQKKKNSTKRSELLRKLAMPEDMQPKEEVNGDLKTLQPTFEMGGLESSSLSTTLTMHDETDEEEDHEAIQDAYDACVAKSITDPVLAHLEGLGTWEFDIFESDELLGDLMLPVICGALIKRMEKLPFRNPVHISNHAVFTFCHKLVKEYYPRTEVLYHNILHATDVMTGTWYLCTAEEFLEYEFVNILGIVMSAAAHDVGHNGYNNVFHIQSGSNLALKYNDQSVLENHHCSLGWKLITESGVLKSIPRSKRSAFRKVFVDGILATDMKFHGDRLNILQKTNPKADPVKLLGHVLHTADISNVAKPFDYCSKWVSLVMEEFFRQGDKEKELGLPVSALCDREKTDTNASEVGFIKYVVKPWYVELNNVLPDVIGPSVKYINENFRNFKDLTLKMHPIKSSSRSILMNNEEEEYADDSLLGLRRSASLLLTSRQRSENGLLNLSDFKRKSVNDLAHVLLDPEASITPPVRSLKQRSTQVVQSRSLTDFLLDVNSSEV